eukprot:TRINITY_DN30960_c0_g3_i2.p1 TRINITY_DN30960_c0_g3~~TRINITY_DN30960_c0_g3_i2.p1  ORF type:complete len:1319 (+),score=503.93 TRINITY_DN30960_c0_g3_i2:124-4080(+)
MFSDMHASRAYDAAAARRHHTRGGPSNALAGFETPIPSQPAVCSAFEAQRQQICPIAVVRSPDQPCHFRATSPPAQVRFRAGGSPQSAHKENQSPGDLRWQPRGPAAAAALAFGEASSPSANVLHPRQRLMQFPAESRVEDASKAELVKNLDQARLVNAQLHTIVQTQQAQIEPGHGRVVRAGGRTGARETMEHLRRENAALKAEMAYMRPAAEDGSPASTQLMLENEELKNKLAAAQKALEDRGSEAASLQAWQARLQQAAAAISEASPESEATLELEELLRSMGRQQGKAEESPRGGCAAAGDRLAHGDDTDLLRELQAEVTELREALATAKKDAEVAQAKEKQLESWRAQLQQALSEDEPTATLQDLLPLPSNPSDGHVGFWTRAEKEAAAEAKLEVTRLAADLGVAQAAVRSAEQRHEEGETRLKAVEQREQEKVAALQAVQQEAEVRLAAAHEAAEALQAKAEAAAAAEVDLRGRLRAKESAAAALEAEVARLREQMDAQAGELLVTSARAKELEKMQEHIATSTDKDKKQLQEQLTAEVAKRVRAEAELEMATASVAEKDKALQAAAAKGEAEADRQKKQLEASEKAMEHEAEEAGAVQRKLLAQLETAEATNSELREELARVTSRLAEIQAASADGQAEAQERVLALGEELDALRRGSDRREAELVQARDVEAAAKQELQGRLLAAEADASEASLREQASRAQLEEKQLELKAVEKALEEARRGAVAVEAELAGKLETVAQSSGSLQLELRERAALCESRAVEIQRLASEVESHRVRLASCEAEAAGRQSTLEASLRVLQEELQESRGLREAVEEDLRAAKGEGAANAAKAAALLEDLERQKQTSQAALTTALATQGTDWRLQIERLQDKASAKARDFETELDALRRRLDEEISERVRHGARAEALEHELAPLKASLAASHDAAAKDQEARLRAAALLEQAEAQRAALREELEAEREALGLAEAAAARAEAEIRSLRASQEDSHADKEDVEKLRLQNKEMSLTMLKFKQDLEALNGENRSLRDSVALFEGELEHVSDRHAQLIGHVNQKQKIRYTLKLKDEKNQLRAELDKARGKLAQLELRDEKCQLKTLFEALASVGYMGAAETAAAAGRPSAPHLGGGSPIKPQSPELATRTPRASSATTGAAGAASHSSQLRTPKRSLRSNGGGGPDCVRDEAVRRCRVQERALERITADFSHLVMLVERAVEGANHGSSSREKAADSADKANFAGLLQRLRGMVGACRQPSQQDGAKTVEGGDREDRPPPSCAEQEVCGVQRVQTEEVPPEVTSVGAISTSLWEGLNEETDGDALS